MSARKKWFPLESNPTVMNAYVEKLGFPTRAFSFCDVLSTEEWALGMVPKPVLGVILLYPKHAKAEAFADGEARRIEASGQIVSPNVYFMTQSVGNACGTVGLLHAIGNMRQHVTLDESSFLGKLFRNTVGKTANEIGAYLANDDEIEDTHGSAAQAGQSEQLEHLDAPIDTHFICFSFVDGHLYELDGDKAFPINHGVSSPETLLQDACKAIKQFMARDKGELRFTILALTKTPSCDEST